MEKMLFEELKKTDWFDCEEDIDDLISSIIEPLKKGEICEAVDESMDWIDGVYDNLHKDIEFDIPETRKFLHKMYYEIFNKRGNV